MRDFIAFVALLAFAMPLSSARAQAKEPESPTTPSWHVVIDPGHGGGNTGAPGVVEGVYEKHLTLPISRALKNRLERTPGLRVTLTRTKDEYLTLRERMRFANQAGADLFLSIHANASPSHTQRGFETFVLAPEKLRIDAKATRGHDGPKRDSVPKDVAAILDDAEQTTAQRSAIRLAHLIQSELAAVRNPETNRGVREGNQDVLMGLTMPGVLVELGFIDHPIEGVELMKKDVRTKLVNALEKAILAFVRDAS